MNRSPKISVLLVTSLIAFGSCTTTMRQNPNFAARRRQITTVAVMPPEVKIHLTTVKRANRKPLPEDEANLRSRLPGAVAKALEARGFAVRKPEVFQAKLAESSDLRLLTTQVNDSFLQAAHEAYAGQNWDGSPDEPTSTAGRYQRSLGPAVASIADHAAADALVLVDMEGFRSSPGAIALEFAESIVIGVLTLGGAYVGPPMGATLVVALVDGASGDVLWQNIAGTQMDFAAPGVVEDMVQQLFAKLPTDAGATPSTGERLGVAPAAPPAPPSQAVAFATGSSASAAGWWIAERSRGWRYST
jgi:hypothetical protein